MAEGPRPENRVDKYNSRNPLVKRAVANFIRDFDALRARCRARAVVDVGCGEGVLTRRLAAQSTCRVVAVDTDCASLRVARRREPTGSVAFRRADIASLPFADHEFELACATEVLEHVADPWAALSELSRVARCHLLVSVPREPLWRICNLLRASYVTSLGNTPGHIHHWSPRAFAALVSSFGSIDELRLPVPWIMALVRVDRG